MFEIRNSSGTVIAQHLSYKDLYRLDKEGLIRFDDKIFDETNGNRVD